MENYHWSLISAILGAVSGLIAAYWRTRYTIRSQDLSKRIEELCNSISKLEDLSCQYWGGGDDSSKRPSPHYILGNKTKISLLVTYLDSEYTQFNKDKTSVSLADFFEACTSGDFENNVEKNESERLRKILITGEKLKIELLRIRSKLY
ncbi:TPA: hypothetical protein ACOEBK_000613 [Enterobacter ludwigii]